MKNKIIGLVFISALLLSMSGVSAVYYKCGHTVNTGKGNATAGCSGHYIRGTGHYSSTSEKYMVMIHLGDGNTNIIKSGGCYAGKRDVSISHDTVETYLAFPHTHMYTVNLI